MKSSFQYFLPSLFLWQMFVILAMVKPHHTGGWEERDAANNCTVLSLFHISTPHDRTSKCLKHTRHLPYSVCQLAMFNTCQTFITLCMAHQSIHTRLTTNFTIWRPALHVNKGCSVGGSHEVCHFLFWFEGLFDISYIAYYSLLIAFFYENQVIKIWNL